jgi:hypothetical protein
MKTKLIGVGLLALFLAPQIMADEPPMVVYAQNPDKVRIRTDQIRSWSGESDTRMVLTTKRRDQYLVEFARPCFNLSRGPSSSALVTDYQWLDRNSHIRLLDRDRLPGSQLSALGGGNFEMHINSYSSFCPIKDITALGRKASARRDNA